jgi:outer membrane immunogenic protein
VKGGAAFGRYSYEFRDFDVHSFDASGTSVGWLVGAGIEYALFANWTIKLEYDYLNFGNKSFSAVHQAQLDRCAMPSLCRTFGPPYSFTVNETQSMIKLGVNYKFY